MSVSDPKLVEIYRARNVPEAFTIRTALESAGVHVRIEGEMLQGGLGQLPFGWYTAPRILVLESQLSMARDIIERERLRKTARPRSEELEHVTRCLACGSMMSAIEAECSVCGWSFQGEGQAETDADANGGCH